jgi:four helix bundle protein
MDLVDAVYDASRSWPSDERFGLTSQIRRAAVSVPANIAEGQGRDGDPEFLRFLRIAMGSLAEVETMVRIGTRQGFDDLATQAKVLSISREVGRITNGLIRSKDAKTRSNRA